MLAFSWPNCSYDFHVHLFNVKTIISREAGSVNYKCYVTKKSIVENSHNSFAEQLEFSDAILKNNEQYHSFADEKYNTVANISHGRVIEELLPDNI